MKRQEELALRRQILLETALLQQTIVRLQLDRISRAPVLKVARWIGPGLRGAAAALLARLIESRRA